MSFFCPSCQVSVELLEDGSCALCGGTPKLRPGKPAGKHGKLAEKHLRLLHQVHLRGASVRELGCAIWEDLGFASARSAAESIYEGWKRLGLEARPQPAATVLSNRQRRIPGSPGSDDRAAAKRFHRKRKGGYRRCAGVRVRYPRKGERCQRWAMEGSEFCLQHDPERREEVEAIVAQAREAQRMREAVAA